MDCPLSYHLSVHDVCVAHCKHMINKKRTFVSFYLNCSGERYDDSDGRDDDVRSNFFDDEGHRGDHGGKENHRPGQSDSKDACRR